MKLKDYPLDHRPRQKAIKYGLESLSDVELLAIILKSGSKKESVLELSQRIVNDYQDIANLKYANLNELTKYDGIQNIKAITILSSIELAKRILKKDSNKEKTCIKEPIDGYYAVKDRLMFTQQERVIVLCLNSQLEIISDKTIFIGSIDFSIIKGQEIFKQALICGSNRIMIIHNHPSGNPNPSSEDKEITKRLLLMAKQLEIEIIDHLIIGNNCFYSFNSKRTYEVNDIV